MEIFYCYSSSLEDQNLQKELAQQLVPLKRQGVITDWNYRDILAGEEWRNEINAHLEQAQIILLLVSPAFIASDYCNNNEVKRAMERHTAGEARVIPIILRPCMWESAPFGKLQALPKDGKPITKWDNKDEALLDVAERIKDICIFLQQSFIQEQQKAKDTQIAQAAKIAQKLSSHQPIDGLILAITVLHGISKPSQLINYLGDRLMEAIKVAR